MLAINKYKRELRSTESRFVLPSHFHRKLASLTPSLRSVPSLIPHFPKEILLSIGSLEYWSPIANKPFSHAALPKWQQVLAWRHFLVIISSPFECTSFVIRMQSQRVFFWWGVSPSHGCCSPWTPVTRLAAILTLIAGKMSAARGPQKWPLGGRPHAVGLTHSLIRRLAGGGLDCTSYIQKGTSNSFIEIGWMEVSPDSQVSPCLAKTGRDIPVVRLDANVASM